MIYRYEKSSPRWIDFENPTGEKGGAARSNHGAKGHPWEHLDIGEEKVLCDLDGSGIVRRIWMTLNDPSPEMLHKVILKMFWDGAKEPQVMVPLGDFFGMGHGSMERFENACFSTAEGRSFCCRIPMPFKSHCKILLCNQTGFFINNLFYDVDVTLQEVGAEDMLFHAVFRETVSEPEQDVEILPKITGAGRFLGTSITVFPNEAWYGDLWWGEGEVKIYLDGDTDTPTIAGTGTEDYFGSAWGLGEFINQSQGCVKQSGQAVSMYRFHTDDPIFFGADLKVTIQAMGGGAAEKVKRVLEKGYPCVPVTYDDGEFHPIYRTGESADLAGWVNFYRSDRYRTVAYYYLKSE